MRAILKIMRDGQENSMRTDIYKDETFLANEQMSNKGIHSKIAYEIGSLSNEGVIRRVDGRMQIVQIYRPEIIAMINEVKEARDRIFSTVSRRSSEKAAEEWEKMDEVAAKIHKFFTEGEVDNR